MGYIVTARLHVLSLFENFLCKTSAHEQRATHAPHTVYVVMAGSMTDVSDVHTHLPASRSVYPCAAAARRAGAHMEIGGYKQKARD